MNGSRRWVTDPLKAVRGLAHLRRAFGVSAIPAISDFLKFRRAIDAGWSDFMYLRLWDRTVPEAERLKYLCHNDRVRVERLINPKAGQLEIQDKASANALLVIGGIPTTQILAVVSPRGSDSSGNRRLADIEGLRRLLAESHPEGIVIKPASGMKGEDVHVFSGVAFDGLTHADGSTWSIDRLWGLLSRPPKIASSIRASYSWLIERRLWPHPDLAALHGNSLSCVRVTTTRFDDGEVGFLPPIWKIPVGTSGVDNLAYGSFVAPVEPVTGMVGTPISQDSMLPIERHPDTDRIVEGTVLPHWEEVADLARRATVPFPLMRSLGFDIALTAEGARIVEVNTGWGAWGPQSATRTGLMQGNFLRLLEDVGAEDVIRRVARKLM